ncbi:MAG: hypothetical protein CMP22_07555 [Rickettsiales bacterium]|nr:hypothetical protein [Rickettsiales bacterium]
MKPDLFFDGKTSQIHEVEVSPAHDMIVIKSRVTGLLVTWSFEDIILNELGKTKKGRPFVFSNKHDQDARLHCYDRDTSNQIISNMHHSQKQEWIGASGRALLILAVFAIFFIVSVYKGLPLFSKAVAPHLPETVVSYISGQIEADLMRKFSECNDAEVKSHVEDIVLSLEIEDFKTKEDFEIVLIKSRRKPNAFVLPGRKIFIFSSLLNEAKSVDEIAGILAHEIGHIHHYHANEAMVRQAGFFTTMQMISWGLGFGDTASRIGVTLANLSFSREDELEADDFMMEVIAKSPYSIKGATDFFERRLPTVKTDNEYLKTAEKYLSTHPMVSIRIERFKARSSKEYYEVKSKRLDKMNNLCLSSPTQQEQSKNE